MMIQVSGGVFYTAIAGKWHRKETIYNARSIKSAYTDNTGKIIAVVERERDILGVYKIDESLLAEDLK